MTKVRTDLTALLEQEITHLDSLISLLIREKDILVNRKFEELEDISAQKQALCALMEDSARQRIQVIGAQANAADYKTALGLYLKQLSKDEADEIESLNKTLAEKLTTCREYNTINGQVITTNIITRQEMIGALTGQSATTAPNVYTASGNIKPDSDSGHHQKA
ncbi:flagella synthesis protein FlgN [Legionella erythra]|uniref:Flagellar biosynthesis/type III secretory pathway chaperone n=1 Tax=Legionella erythra TaxID=448 RepID=A0A0W0TQL2_LEGER|nr:flagellar protein FlgN [Legionella erythra]KTC97954.1 flagellar biosynthesis/type III secretory pathway chaperone [Legionella erythra]